MIYYMIKCHLNKHDEEELTQFFFAHDCIGCELIEKPDLNDINGELYTLHDEDYPEEGVIVIAYFASSKIIHHLHAYLQTHNLKLLSDVQISKVSNIDGESYKEYFKPISIDDRLLVVPSWIENVSEDKIVTKILPGTGFGTGSHPSTKLALKLLSRYIKSEDVMLDWGTGSGILAISAKKLGARSVTALDIDELALKNARVNIELNQVVVKLLQGSIETINGVFSLIISNIVKKVLLAGMKTVYDRLQHQGLWILSGIVKTESEEVLKELTKNHFTLVEMISEDIWCSLVVRKEVG
ncbi:MAG: 50S ribosomal protein L11 methyltransferase [Bacilli bacterium]|nr:50S ribosomal protein L11 methyltransferase [Bacilli bacterium]